MEIKNDTAKKKFVTRVSGGEAVILYRRGPNNSYDLFATEVPVEARGQNVASELVKEALRAAKNENVQIIATCPYVQSWFRKHPEEARILARPISQSPSASPS